MLGPALVVVLVENKPSSLSLSESNNSPCDVVLEGTSTGSLTDIAAIDVVATSTSVCDGFESFGASFFIALSGSAIKGPANKSPFDAFFDMPNKSPPLSESESVSVSMSESEAESVSEPESASVSEY